MPTWFVTSLRLGSLCDHSTPGHHRTFTQARFQDSGCPNPHPCCASSHIAHQSIARRGASSRDRGFLHCRLSTISGDTLGIALCTLGSNPSHPAGQSSCINFKRKVHYRTNELDKGISRRNRKVDSVEHSDSRHLCSNDAEAFFNTIVITRHSSCGHSPLISHRHP